MSKEIVWTTYGIDGVGSYLTLKWLLGTEYEIKNATPRSFRDEFTNWCNSTNINDYKRIFIVGLDLSVFLRLVDLPNVVVIDNHPTHIKRSGEYKMAKVILSESSSCTKLIYKLFSEKYGNRLNDSHRIMIGAIDDFVSGKKQIELSTQLNLLYWGITPDRVAKFIEYFRDGFVNFDSIQLDIITLQRKRLAQVLNGLNLFCGVFDNTTNVVSTFATQFIDEVFDHLLKSCQADVAIIVNPNTKSVFFKKRVGSKVSIISMSKALCNGGGTEVFAGGELTDMFLNFTKQLKPLC